MPSMRTCRRISAEVSSEALMRFRQRRAGGFVRCSHEDSSEALMRFRQRQ
jgi:hypothetical protein